MLIAMAIVFIDGIVKEPKGGLPFCLFDPETGIEENAQSTAQAEQ